MKSKILYWLPLVPIVGVMFIFYMAAIASDAQVSTYPLCCDLDEPKKWWVLTIFMQMMGMCYIAITFL